MIKSDEQCLGIQAIRYIVKGKKGFSRAVRRYYCRTRNVKSIYQINDKLALDLQTNSGFEGCGVMNYLTGKLS